MKKYSLTSKVLSCALIFLAGTFLPASMHFNHAMAAAMLGVSSQPTSNIVTTKASYEILFTPATSGAIKFVTIAFPAGFNVGSISLIERSGIGAGALSASGTTITYTVTSPVSIAAGIPIRFELSNIIHPGVPGTYSISVTTKNSLGNIIDGPTAGTSSVVQIGTSALANGAVTETKMTPGVALTNFNNNNPVTSLSVTATPATSFVRSIATYEIDIKTAKTGIVKTIQMQFLPNYRVDFALLSERSGIGAGTLSAPSAQLLTYTVNNPVSIPAGTQIRLEITNIINPPVPGVINSPTVTTKDSLNNVIETGTASDQGLSVVQIATSDIADNAITSSKIASSLMYQVLLNADSGGNAVGWNPDGTASRFEITDSGVTTNSQIVVTLIGPCEVTSGCDGVVVSQGNGVFDVNFSNSPMPVTSLLYTVINPALTVK